MSFVITGNKALERTEASSLLEHKRRKWINLFNVWNALV